MMLLKEYKNGKKFGCSADIAYYKEIQYLRNEDRENFIVLGLSNKNKVLFKELVHIGIANQCLVGIPEIFRQLITKGAVRFIAIHNHPSGEVTPSAEDSALTRKLVDVGNLVGIKLLDHIILGEEDYFSFADVGMIS